MYAVPPGFTGDGLFDDEEALFSEDQAAVVVDSPPPPAAEADASDTSFSLLRASRASTSKPKNTTPVYPDLCDAEAEVQRRKDNSKKLAQAQALIDQYNMQQQNKQEAQETQETSPASSTVSAGQGKDTSRKNGVARQLTSRHCSLHEV